MEQLSSVRSHTLRFATETKTIVFGMSRQFAHYIENQVQKENLVFSSAKLPVYDTSFDSSGEFFGFKNCGIVSEKNFDWVFVSFVVSPITCPAILDTLACVFFAAEKFSRIPHAGDHLYGRQNMEVSVDIQKKIVGVCISTDLRSALAPLQGVSNPNMFIQEGYYLGSVVSDVMDVVYTSASGLKRDQSLFHCEVNKRGIIEISIGDATLRSYDNVPLFAPYGLKSFSIKSEAELLSAIVGIFTVDSLFSQRIYVTN